MEEDRSIALRATKRLPVAAACRFRERRSTIVTTNLAFSEWVQVFSLRL